MSIGEVLGRMISSVGGKTQTDLGQFLGISQSGISDAKRKGKVPPEWVVKLAVERNLNPNWLLTGQGSMYIEGTDSNATILGTQHHGSNEATQGQSRTDREQEAGERKQLDPHEGSKIAFRVLSSNTSYAGALWENLISFNKAVEREEEMESMKLMMAQLLEDNKKMLEKMDSLERSVADQTTSPEKRDDAANA